MFIMTKSPFIDSDDRIVRMSYKKYRERSEIMFMSGFALCALVVALLLP